MAELVCYRAATYSGALWQVANPNAARFNVAGEAPTQYLSLHPLGPWAELARHLRIPRAEIEEMIDRGELRHRTWAIRITDDMLVPVGFPDAAAHGIAPDSLVADHYADCQAWATSLRRAGISGIRVPSAALPGSECAVLFGPYIESGYTDVPLDAVDLPTSVSAEDATALRGLLPLVRLFGEPHPALEAHLVGDIFDFVEPTYALA